MCEKLILVLVHSQVDKCMSLKTVFGDFRSQIIIKSGQNQVVFLFEAYLLCWLRHLPMNFEAYFLGTVRSGVLKLWHIVAW